MYFHVYLVVSKILLFYVWKAYQILPLCQNCPSDLPAIILLTKNPKILTKWPPIVSTITNANKHLRIYHHLRMLVLRGLYKPLLYFYFTTVPFGRNTIIGPLAYFRCNPGPSNHTNFLRLCSPGDYR